MGVVVAVDAGTTGVRAVAVDEAGAIVGWSYRELPQHFPRPGWVEHDPEDARAALITTTPAGRAALQQVREERTAFLVDRLHALAAEDRSRLVALVSLLEDLAGAPPEP